MGSFLHKWLLGAIICLLFTGAARHPIYVSVVQIDHNAKERSLEISCKLFTDDFERTLRLDYKTHVDLLNPASKAAMDKLVSDYIKKHLVLNIDGKQVALQYLGYERIDEGIYSYFEVQNVNAPKTVGIFDDLLYSYHEQQMGLIHVVVNGIRKSTKLNNPESRATINF